jgi:hypothetical protein
VLRWNLQNVTFNDGGTATGFFALDTAPESQPADFDVKVTGGKYPSFEYSPQSSASFRTSATFTPGNNLVVFYPRLGTRAFRLGTPTLTQTGTYSLTSLNSNSSVYDMSNERMGIGGGFPPDRSLLTGSITTGIPEQPKHGTLVRWTLEGVKFGNGGTASGSFIYDASRDTVVDFNLHSDESALGDINQLFPCQPSCWRVSVFPDFPSTGTVRLAFNNGGLSPGGTSDLNLVTGETLTDEGGKVSLLHSSGFDFGGQLGGSSNLIAGSLIGTPVPEPSEALLLALGFVALVGFSTRRGRAQKLKEDSYER